jgi:hypothetical protein
MKQRALARADTAQQTDQIPGWDLEIDVFQLKREATRLNPTTTTTTTTTTTAITTTTEVVTIVAAVK